MALEINNAQFSQFVQFAEQQMQAGKSKAVARVGDAQAGPLAGRTITAAKGEFVGNIWRSVDTRNANGFDELFGRTEIGRNPTRRRSNRRSPTARPLRVAPTGIIRLRQRSSRSAETRATTGSTCQGIVNK